MNHLLVQGDSRRLPLADGSVHVCITSPPYWGLRDYGTAKWMGGDPGCDHQGIDARTVSGGPGKQYSNEGSNRVFSGDCKCGARRIDSQLGLEATPDLFVAAMTGVFREVWRVLRDDGTAWVNLGDSYTSGNRETQCQPSLRKGQNGVAVRPPVNDGLKPKDLVGIPWRVAFALQADGWYLRSDIIYSKPNPMPESVSDRPTKSHEYLFLLSKRERYFWDQEAVREKQTGSIRPRSAEEKEFPKSFEHGHGVKANGSYHRAVQGHVDLGGRNIRSVWEIPSESFPGAHFATFPRKLVAPCVKAGTSARGVCPTCGAPWERLTERQEIQYRPNSASNRGNAAYDALTGNRGAMGVKSSTLGWRSTCSHDAPPIPATVLDPFAGSGTTGVVALALNRRFIGVDLSAKYLTMAERRISRPHARVERAGKPEALPLFAGLDA